MLDPEAAVLHHRDAADAGQEIPELFVAVDRHRLLDTTQARGYCTAP